MTNPQGQPSAKEANVEQEGTDKEGVVAQKSDTFSKVNPDTLPPELQSIYKNMQADYTRKTQEIADVREKAKAFDELTADEDFGKWARDRLVGDEGKETTEIVGEEKAEGEEETEITKLSKRVESMENKYWSDKAESELATCRAKHDDFNRLLPRIWPLVNKGYSYEDSYCLAKNPEIIAELEKTKVARATREGKDQTQGITETPSAGSSTTETKVTEKPSFDEAVKRAKAKLELEEKK